MTDFKPFEIKLPAKIGRGCFFDDEGAPYCSVGQIIEATTSFCDFTFIDPEWKTRLDISGYQTLHVMILSAISTLFNEKFGYNSEEVFDDLNQLILDNDEAAKDEDRKALLTRFVSKYPLAVVIK